MDSNNSVYVRMMVDVLKRKEKILQRILKQTKEQEVILKQEDVDYERFQSILDEKGKQIDELNEIDEGFDALFKKVEKRNHGSQRKLFDRDCYDAEIDFCGIGFGTADSGAGSTEQ